MPKLMISIWGTIRTHFKEQRLLTSTNGDAAHLLKRKETEFHSLNQKQVAIYLEIQGNSSSPTPLLFFSGMLAKMQLEDMRKECIFNLDFDYIPFQAKTNLQLEIFINKDKNYEQPTSRSIYNIKTPSYLKCVNSIKFYVFMFNHNQVKSFKIKSHLVFLLLMNVNPFHQVGLLHTKRKTVKRNLYEIQNLWHKIGNLLENIF